MASAVKRSALILCCLSLFSPVSANAQTLLIGKTVTLQSRMMQTVAISTKADAWNDADILVRAPNGTAAEIVGLSKFRLTRGEELNRYQVKISYQGKEYVGWVHESFLQEQAEATPPAPLPVTTIDEEHCAPLLKNYGAEAVGSVIQTARKGVLTVEVKSELREMSGLPDFSYLTPRSVCRDLALTGMPLQEFTERIIAQRAVNLQAAAKRAEEQQREQERDRERMEEAQRRAEAERRRLVLLETGPEGENCRDSTAAYVMSQAFVKEQLKAPATAQFPGFSSVQTNYLGKCRHLVRAYVDSENSFSALLRTRYVATVRYNGGGMWALDGIEFIRPR